MMGTVVAGFARGKGAFGGVAGIKGGKTDGRAKGAFGFLAGFVEMAFGHRD
jgi:hypothetical protein